VIFEQFYLGCLAHASYMVGSEGVAAVIDPQRDVEIYLEAARRHGVEIRFVIETHLHADFVSGHLELAARTGAEIALGKKARPAFPAIAITDGEALAFGKCLLHFLETPGHTPESISILVTDLDRGDEPFAILTGDTLFLGDVGRPDLSDENTPEELAGMLYDSLHEKILPLDDELLVYPAHGAGSLCGRQISSDRCTTLGVQKRTNYACQPMAREEFVRMMTTDLPARPGYFAHDVEMNRAGAAPLAAKEPLPPMTAEAVEAAKAAGAVVLDTRPGIQFAACHVPGSLHIALGGQFASWAGAVLGLDRDVVLVCEEESKIEEARTRLARVGIERVIGYLDGGVLAYPREGRELAQLPLLTVTGLKEMLNTGDVALVDVRNPGEYREGVIEGARQIPLGGLAARIPEIDRAKTVVLHCKGGYRSSIAASILLAAGFPNVMNLTGGYDAWKTMLAKTE
jgi:glyoxylase-like metal-dependent hydrolase (beta-lactamase superfamily II)/rhodanese-related sulfurtransferase